MLSNPLILCCPLLLLPSIFPSIRVLSNESAPCIRWPKCWSFSFGISPSNELLFSHSPCIIACQAPLSSTISSIMSIELVMLYSHFIFCYSLILSPSIFPSTGVISNESALRWPKYWTFSFNISPSNEHSGLISFRMHWLDVLAVQGTLKSLLQHHSSKASILRCSAFFIVQSSHPYITTRKTRALTRWTFVDKVMSLFFNMLSRLVIGEGNGTPLQYSCLENPMDRGAW